MELLTKEQLAEKLNVSTWTIDNYLRKGLKPLTKTPLRFTLEGFIEWENNEQKRKEILKEGSRQ